MGTERAHLIITDPPYGVDYNGGDLAPRAKMVGDTAPALYGPTCLAAAEWSDPEAPLYSVVSDPHSSAAALGAIAAAGYVIRAACVWNKNHAQFGSLSAQYKIKHESFHYCHKRRCAPRWYGPTNEVTVWDRARAVANEFHPTQKPVELAARAIANSSAPGMCVLDLFADLDRR